MATKVPAELLKEVLALPAEARAAMAVKLLDSLDIEVDEGAEARWREEIERRLQEVDDGRVSPIPGWEVRESILRD